MKSNPSERTYILYRDRSERDEMCTLKECTNSPFAHQIHIRLLSTRNGFNLFLPALVYDPERDTLGDCIHLCVH